MFKDRYQTLYTQVIPEEKLLKQTKEKMESAAGKRMASKWILPLSAAACLLIIASFGVYHVFYQLPQIINSVGNPFTRTTTFASQRDSSSINASSVIQINEMGELNKQPIISCGPSIKETINWSVEKYVKYLGIDPQKAAIPHGLTFVGQSSREMKYAGKDKLINYYNTWDFIYTADKNDAHAKEVHIYTNKDFIPYSSAPRAYQLTDKNEQTSGKSWEDQLKAGKKSIINGMEVIIWHKASGTGYKWGWDGGDYEFKEYYCADFRYKTVGFTVTAENGVTQQEFIDLLSSILKR